MVRLSLTGRVFESISGNGVSGRTIIVQISYISGGSRVDKTITLGPTGATGFASACQEYPANVQLTISTQPVDNGTGPDGPALSNVQVQNESPQQCN
jgi:hypothetical protein